jgi:hypothetical protein
LKLKRPVAARGERKPRNPKQDSFPPPTLSGGLPRAPNVGETPIRAAPPLGRALDV